MKTTNVSTTETPTPTQRSDAEIATDIQARISSVAKLIQKREKNNAETNTLSDKILRLLQKGGAQIIHGEPWDGMLKRLSSFVLPDDLHEFGKATMAIADNVTVAQKLETEIKTAKLELRKIVQQEGGRRDRELLAAHGAMVSKIIEGILPFCNDSIEAEATALGMNEPTRLHLRVAGWRRGYDELGMATTLARELQQPIPAIKQQ